MNPLKNSEDILLQKLKKALAPELLKVKTPAAAFDADGTLWREDVGREFFQYQIKKGILPADSKARFEIIKQNQGWKSSIQWLAQMQKGHTETELKSWVKDFLNTHPPKIFLFQKKLIQWLKSQSVKIFIVSSSLTWILEEALKPFAIPSAQVIGVATYVTPEGLITDELIYPSPVQEDKPLAFYEKTQNFPLFSAGNTLSDQALLEKARIRLAVSSALKSHKNYSSEQDLLKLARQNNWFCLENPALCPSSRAGIKPRD